MSFSPLFIFSKAILTASSLAMLTAIASTANAATITLQPETSHDNLISQTQKIQLTSENFGVTRLKAGKEDVKYGQNKQNNDTGVQNNNNQVNQVSIDLRRAKNLARQAGEKANGGLGRYRAEASMHGPANESSYVDNGDSWTFKFLGRQPDSTTMTIETVVTVAKDASRVVVDYNGPIRATQPNQVEQ